MNRRASLPSVDELFGGRNEPPRRRAPQDPAEAPRSPGEPLGETAREPEVPATEAAVAERPAERSAAPTSELPELVRRLTAAEDTPQTQARSRASDTLDLPSPEVGALLRWAALACQARAAVEVGAAGGVSGLWLLGALPTGGVLTSIEPDPDAHRLASEAFQGTSTHVRARSIHGDAATVLPRLSDGSYDLVLLQTSPSGFPEDLPHARRLLRPGGTLIVRGVLNFDEHGEALTRFHQDLSESSAFSVVVLPLDDGVAVATRLGNGTR